MPNKKDKRKGIVEINHQDCVNKMDLLHNKLEDKENDYNNLLLQNNTLKNIVTDLEKQLNDSKSQIKDLQYQLQNLTSCIISPPVKLNIVDTPEYIQLELERNELAVEVEELKGKQDEMEKIMDSLGINDNFGGLLDFLKLLYENKDEFMEFLNIKKNKIVHEKKINDPILLDVKSSSEYISLKNDYDNLNNRIKELEKNGHDENIDIDSKIKEVLDKQEKIFYEKVEKINNAHVEEIKNIKLQYENAKQSMPSPSSSSETKKGNKKNKKSENTGSMQSQIIKLPENLFEVLYYRYVNNNNYIPRYFIENNKKYLKCCNQEYKNKEIDKENITCIKCFKTYKLFYKNDINDYKLDKFILNEHFINNESEILKRITCCNCGYIDKKEIKICFKCKKMENALIHEFKLPNKNEAGYEANLLVAQETFTKVLYTSNVYNKAIKSGVDPSNFKEIVNYIKENKMVEEQQINIIKNKIYRCYSIESLYNDEKYIPIQGYIQRINFSIKAVSKLDQKQWIEFRNNLIYKLDKELKNNNINNIKIDENKFKKECCIKCDTELKGNELENCSNCIKLCIFDDCKNGRDGLMEYCNKHMLESLKSK